MCKPTASLTRMSCPSSPPSPQLWAACQRTLALPLGRGALAAAHRSLPVGSLCLAGMVPGEQQQEPQMLQQGFCRVELASLRPKLLQAGARKVDDGWLIRLGEGNGITF